jgi:hypothetical protein
LLCSPAVAHHTRYPGHGKGLGGIPWFEGTPHKAGPVGLAGTGRPGGGTLTTGKVAASVDVLAVRG